MNKPLSYTLSILGFLLLVPAANTWGRVELSPRFTLREEYNDNIYLARHNPESDFITRAFPALAFKLDSDYLDVTLDYGLQFIYYADHPDENETRIKDVQRATGVAEILPGRDFTLTVEDHISRVTIDERAPVVEESSFVNRTNLNRLVVNPRYQYRAIHGFTGILGYRFEKLAYQSSEGDDSRSHAGYGDFLKDLSRRLSLTLYYEYSDNSAKYTEDYTRQDLRGGIIYKISPRWTFTGQAGQSWLDYSERASQSIDLWSARLDYQITSAWTAGAHYAQEVLFAVTDGLYERKTARLFASRQTGVLFDIEGNATRDTYQTIDRRDESVGGKLGIGLPLVSNILLRLSGDYSYWKFDPEAEHVHRFGGGPALEYARNRLAVALGYRYREEISNVDVNEYVVQIIFIEGTLAF